MFCNSPCLLFCLSGFGTYNVTHRRRCHGGVLVLVHISVQLNFQVICCNINGFVEIVCNPFRYHRLLFNCCTDTYFSLMVFADFHGYAHTGYFQIGVIGEQRFHLGGGVAPDQFGYFEMTAVDDDLHKISPF